MIAGYITATQVKLARATQRKGELHLLDRMSFDNCDFSDFSSILKLYRKRVHSDSAAACFGVAGPVINNAVTATNIPWRLDTADIAGEFGFKQVRLINDLEATAHGLFLLKDDSFYTINEGAGKGQGNIGMVAAGTGLGEALISFDGRTYTPYASEGGHADFAPGSQLEAELWEYIYAHRGYVEVEDVVSLPGLETIYRFLIEHDRMVTGDWFKKARDKPAAIIEKALADADDVAVKTLDMLVDSYASEAANLALCGMTTGGVYLCGSIAPQIATHLDQGRFMSRFVKKGKMGSLLSEMPVGVILEKETALLGAAAAGLKS
ncbi:MAG: glucokinase [candidate division Zixibacteria bacterium]|nr:glucokinase [candidate division Zixibacteria bacterium]MDH3936556.1 glucokinase [candidate division Zixibacteria bacterium]MDH4034578.1 glucokinase [candidate division Zixibacteria bacterium]